MAKNPVDDYLDTKIEKRAERDQKHIGLWQTWQQDPNPKTLKPLLKQFEPLVNTAVRNWKAPNVNEAAFRSKVQGEIIKGLEVYDPNRGASLNTHLTNRVQKVKRFNTQGQNLAYIPEEKAKYIGKIDAAVDQLREDHGRDPTHAEIAGVVGITSKLVKEVQGLRRADIRSSAFMSDPLGHTGSRDQEVIALLRPELSVDEQKVYDHLYGKNGKRRVTSTGELATLLGKSPSQVSRLKNRIAEAYNKYK